MTTTETDRKQWEVVITEGGRTTGYNVYAPTALEAAEGLCQSRGLDFSAVVDVWRDGFEEAMERGDRTSELKR